MLRVDHISKSYASAAGSRVVLSDLCLEVMDRRFATLVGPNGCGKSTLLNLIAGLMPLDAGSISLELNGDTARKPQVGYVWQDYRTSLLPWLSCVDNVAFPLRVRGIGRVERREQAKRMIAEFLPGIDPNTRCYDLSGGQQQLINLLRSAISRPDIYLLDEPFSALDQERRWATALYVERVWIERRVPTIFVSHDVDEAILLADTIYLMTRFGTIAKEVENRLTRPRSIQMLTAEEHVRCRQEIIEFLVEQTAATYAPQKRAGAA